MYWQELSWDSPSSIGERGTTTAAQIPGQIARPCLAKPKAAAQIFFFILFFLFCLLVFEQRLWVAPDVTKHAVLGKFNEIRPGMYREYMNDVCEKVRATGNAGLLCSLLLNPF